MRTGFPAPDDVPGWRLLVVRVLRCVWFFLGMQQPHVPEDAQLQPESLSCAVRVGDATDVPEVCTGKPLGNAALSKPDLFPFNLACAAGSAEGLVLPSQIHFTWTCLVLRSSRQCSHCVIGRPFFFISKSGRSKCLQEEDLWPLMQVSQAYFLSLIIIF